MTSDLELDLVGIALYMSGYTVHPESALPSALSFQLLGGTERHTFGIFPSADLDELLDV